MIIRNAIGFVFVVTASLAPAQSEPQAKTAAPSRPVGIDLSWAEVLEHAPDQKVVPDAAHRKAIEATRLPWRVRDKASGVELLLIPPGDYTRGAGLDDRAASDREKPAHRVTISKPFYLGRYEITNAQYRKRNPSPLTGSRDVAGSGGDDDPVVDVLDMSWFLDEYSFRLPTEAEWEYACRAGTKSPRYGDLDAIAWHSGNSGRKTHPVGGKLPNPFGLFDMIGNVAEQCLDDFMEDAYSKISGEGATDPLGRALMPDGRPVPRPGSVVMRGGAWDSEPEDCRASSREKKKDEVTGTDMGFRVVKIVGYDPLRPVHPPVPPPPPAPRKPR